MNLMTVIDNDVTILFVHLFPVYVIIWPIIEDSSLLFEINDNTYDFYLFHEKEIKILVYSVLQNFFKTYETMS